MHTTPKPPASSQRNSKQSTAFARAAVIEEFRPCDARALDQGDFQDRAPHQQPRRLGEIVNKTEIETGEKVPCRRRAA